MHYVVLYPQNGDRVVSTDSVTDVTSPCVLTLLCLSQLAPMPMKFKAILLGIAATNLFAVLIVEVRCCHLVDDFVIAVLLCQSISKKNTKMSHPMLGALVIVL